MKIKITFAVFLMWIGIYQCQASELLQDHRNEDSNENSQPRTSFDLNNNHVINAIFQLRDQINIMFDNATVTIERKIGRLESKISNFEAKIESLEKNVNYIKVKVEHINAEVENIEKINSNVLSLEPKIRSTKTEIESIKITLDELKSLPNSIEQQLQKYEIPRNPHNLTTPYHFGSKIGSVIACEHSKVVLQCAASGKTVKIIRANYGRTESGDKICPHPSIRTTDCTSVDSKSKVVAICKGKSDCELFASNSVFGDPCVHTYKYLDVEYSCV